MANSAAGATKFAIAIVTLFEYSCIERYSVFWCELRIKNAKNVIRGKFISA